jgi:RimJ/RimL family protein N-acetyltransferase
MCATDVIAESDRVIVRPWRLDEADRFFDMYRREEVARWIGEQPMMNRAEAEPDILWTLDYLAADPRFGWWAIVERAVGVPAGTVLFKPLVEGAAEIEIGWHLHPDSWGRGLATEPLAQC